MQMHSDNVARTEGTMRIEAYSDAVFAIVATLLILEIQVPHLDALTTPAVIEALRLVLPKFLGFAFSFVMISIFWVNHHHFYHRLTHSDWPLLWHNCHLLFWVTVIPFTTAFLGDYPTTPMVVSLYAAVMCMGALSFRFMLRHAFFHSQLTDKSITIDARTKQYRRSLVGVVAYGAGAIFAHVSLVLAWIPIVFVPLFYFVPQLMSNQHDD